MANDQVDGLEARVHARYSAGVLYAIRFWSDHLSVLGKYDESIAEHLHVFARQKFLFWIESLSLTKQVDMASNAMQILSTWSLVSENLLCETFFAHG